MTETLDVKVPKRTVILEAIQAGGATKESLMELAECSSASLATNFTYLRLMGKYPVKNDDDTFAIVTEAEWAEITADRKAKAVDRKVSTPKTPVELFKMAEKRLERCNKALEVAQQKAEHFGDSEIVQLRLTITTAEARLAQLCLDDAAKGLTEADLEALDTTPDEVDTDTTEDTDDLV